jgi:hypothetical protein
MKDKTGGVERLLGGLAPPEPPHGLQERVLRGARQALAREAGRDVWTRIWESRPLRIAWAVSAGVLVICHIGITEVRSTRTPTAGQTARAAREGNGELAAFGGLARLDEKARPLLGAAAYRLVEESEPDRIAPAKGKGKESAS